MIIDLSSILKQIAADIIETIRDNSDKGIDKTGSPFAAYSQNAHAMPAGALFSPGWKTSARKMAEKDMLKWFYRGGKKWVIVEGGYAQMKQMRFGQDAVNLQVRGIRGKGMLGSLTVVETHKDSVVIGFRNKEAAQLALYHEVLGAGKSKIRRQFMGISKQQEQQIIQKYQGAIAEVIRDGFVVQWVKENPQG